MLHPVNPWIRGFGPTPSAPEQLICFPHAGGTAAHFRPMARALAPTVETFAVQYPGRQDRYQEPLIGTIAELADGATEALLPHLHRPTSLFGHSMGAVVAYEVAIRLEARGHDVRTLFVSGQATPSAHRDNGIHTLDDDKLADELRTLAATDPAVLADRELLEVLLPVIRADYRAIETYRRRDGATVNCPIVSLTGSADPHVDPAQAAAWAAHTQHEFEFHELPGGHFFIDQQRDQVLGIVRKRLSLRLPPRTTQGPPNRA